MQVAAQEKGLKLGFCTVWGGGGRNVEAHSSFKQQWWIYNLIHRCESWGGRSSCGVSEEMLLGANIPLPHCFTCRNGQVRGWGVLDFCLWHQYGDKCFVRFKCCCYEEHSWLLLRLRLISLLMLVFLFFLFPVCGGNMEHKWLQWLLKYTIGDKRTLDAFTFVLYIEHKLCLWNNWKKLKFMKHFFKLECKNLGNIFLNLKMGLCTDKRSEWWCGCLTLVLFSCVKHY